MVDADGRLVHLFGGTRREVQVIVDLEALVADLGGQPDDLLTVHDVAGLHGHYLAGENGLDGEDPPPGHRGIADLDSG